MASGSMTLDKARRILGVDAGCAAGALRAAFNAKVKSAHPDGGGSEEMFRLTVEAYRFLDGRPRDGEGENYTRVDPDTLLDRLEITPSIAVVGGRVETRLQDGRRVAITLPAGKRHGDRISVGGAVMAVFIKGRPGMFVSGDDLCVTIKAPESVLRDGGRIKLKTPAGLRLIWIPKQSGTNHIVRIPGQGLPATQVHPRQGAMLIKLDLAKKVKTESETKRAGFSNMWGAGKAKRA